MANGSTIFDKLDEAFLKIMIEELAQSMPPSQTGISPESVEDLTAGESDTAVAMPLPDLKIPDASEDSETIPLEPPSVEPHLAEPHSVEFHPAEPPLAEPHPVEPQPVEPHPVEPVSVTPPQPAASDVIPPGPVPDKSVRWQLRIVLKDKPECVLPLEDNPVTIGRGRENAIVLNYDRVSREHARIWLDKNRPRVDDLGSRNGILVNGVKVPAAYLKPDDEVTIGSVRIYVEAAE